jgi:hypothetical protein
MINVAVNAAGTLVTAYLMLNVCPQTSESTYRSLLYLGPFVAVEQLTAVAGKLTIASAAIALAINSTPMAFRCGATISILLTIGLYMYVHMHHYAVKAFPNTMIYWTASPAGVPGMASKQDWGNSERVGSHLVSQSAFQFGDDVTTETDGAVLDKKCSETIDSLRAVLAVALPSMTEKRRGIVGRALLKEDLSVKAMQATLALQGGASVLFAALDLEDSRSSQLRRGERVALIAALSQPTATPTQPGWA